MDRTFLADVSDVPPAPPETPLIGYPRNGDPTTGMPATKPGAWWYHSVNEEIRHAIVASGQTPDPKKLDQLANAISATVSHHLSGYATKNEVDAGLAVKADKQTVDNALAAKADKTQLSAYLPVTGGTVSGNITTSSFGTRYGIGEFQCLTFLNNESDQDFEHVPVFYAGYDAGNHARYALTRRGEIVSEVTFNGQYLGRRRIPSIIEKGGTVNWWRKWSDGWLEQGGYFSASEALQSIVFPLPYRNGDYTLTIGTIRSAVNTPNVVIQDKLQSYFNVLSTDGTNGNWHACGWGV